MEEPLMEAEKRGLAVTLISIGECHTRLKNVLVHKRSDDWNNAVARKFSMFCDSRSTLLGSFGQGLRPTVLETDHPSLVELLELAEKYGDHYERIIDSYRKYL
ncbi:hypothetical protein [Paenibacillus elgii]|uniref:hypothetical protein n=1 Tax=Paenibacillus elgii TaxID=189691 RepID=UPI0027B8B4E2|nr:hypothetical protein [Paenibacillus elgii]